MFDNNVAINPATAGPSGSTSSSKTYRLRNIDQGNSDRVREDSTIGAPKTLIVGHRVSGKKGEELDSHVVQVVHGYVGTDGKTKLIKASLTITLPRDTITLQNAIDAVGTVMTFVFPTGAISMLLNGES